MSVIDVNANPHLAHATFECVSTRFEDSSVFWERIYDHVRHYI